MRVPLLLLLLPCVAALSRGRGRKGIVELFDRIHRVEKAMSSAEAQNEAIQQAIQEELTKGKAGAEQLGGKANNRGSSPDK